MECPDVIEGLSAYVDGELGPTEAHAVEEHLASCPLCRRRHELFGAARAAVRNLPREAVSAGFEAVFRRRLAAERGLRHAPRPRSRFLGVAAGLAACLALAVAVSPRRRSEIAAGARPVTPPILLPAAVRTGSDCGLDSPAARCRTYRPCATAATCGNLVGWRSGLLWP